MCFCFDTVPVYDVNKSLFYGHETCDFSTASLNQLDLSLSDDYVFLHDLIYRSGKPNYCPPPPPGPISDSRNHKGAELYPESVDKFIETELSYNALLGPFSGNPFCCSLAVSPLNTVEKDETSRRVIVDLSWPEGTSVNSGIDKDVYLGDDVSLTYPTIDTLTSIIISKGPGALMFKTDLSRLEHINN